MDDLVARRASLFASLALLAFGALTAVALIGWFRQASDDPWTYKSVLALLAMVAGIGLSAVVWRAPSRRNVNAGIAVMLASLARVGLPQEWTWRSFVLVSITLTLLLPLVHASTTLKNET